MLGISITRAVESFKFMELNFHELLRFYAANCAQCQINVRYIWLYAVYFCWSMVWNSWDGVPMKMKPPQILMILQYIVLFLRHHRIVTWLWNYLYSTCAVEIDIVFVYTRVLGEGIPCSARGYPALWLLVITIDGITIND